MRISIGADHAGFSLKEEFKGHLVQAGHEVFDCGTFSEGPSDYPDFAKGVAMRVSKGEADMGVLVCGSGMGMCMVANRIKGVRAAVLRSEADAEISRRHNNANVACFGARLTSNSLAVHLVDIFLKTPFDGGRHDVRVKKIDTL